MSDLHMADLCINHALGVTFAYNSPTYRKFQRDVHLRPAGSNSYVLDHFLDYLEPPPAPGDIAVHSFYSRNIKRHSCSISSFVKDSKRYVWYNNPWGFEVDAKHLLKERALPVPVDVPFRDKTIQDLFRKNIILKELVGVHEEDLIRMNIQRITDFVIAQGGAFYDTFFNKVYDWMNPKRPFSFRWWWNKEWDGNFHVMTLLFFLKTLAGAEHLEVLHPRDTMPSVGPQTSDGICTEVLGNGGVGACSLWTVLYVSKVKEMLGSQLLDPKRNSIASLVYTVKTTLTSELLGGEKTPRDAVARMMGMFGMQEDLKSIMSTIYDMIPDRRDRMKVERRAVFLDLDRIEELVRVNLREAISKECTAAQAASYNANLDNVRCYEAVAGFLEAATVVASVAEKRNADEFKEKLRIIIMFTVRHHKVGNIHFLKQFIKALKTMIKCKHDELVGPGRQENGRVLYPVPRATRGGLPTENDIFETHSRVFGERRDKKRKREGDADT